MQRGTCRGFDPGSEFARLLLPHVERVGGDDVYDSPAAFRAFIRGGGNVALHEAPSAALRDAYRKWNPARVLDIGVGDGLALLPALIDGVHVDVVEPSADLLAETVSGLRRRGVQHRAFECDVQRFAREQAPQRWDLVQSTFALQSLPRCERAEVLSWIAEYTDRLVLVEFDVPEVVDPLEPAWFRGCVSRVERGLREYTEDRDLVGLRFVLPVILGHFAVSGRTNYEFSIDSWVAELRRAGFDEVVASKLNDYWWESAYLVEAQVSR